MGKTIAFRFSNKALNYAWRQLLQRAGVNLDDENLALQVLGIPVHYEHPGRESGVGPRIVICPCPESAWGDLLEKSPASLEWLSSEEVVPKGSVLPFKNSIPVLFGGSDHERENKFVEQRQDGSLVFYADILATSMFMLSRWEETVVPEHDQHARFPAAASVAYKQGFLDIPIVDQYALILREWIKVLRPEWVPEKAIPRVNLTHDIDVIVRFSTGLKFARTVGNILLKQNNLSKAWMQLTALMTQFFSPENDLYFRSIYQLAELSRLQGFSSSFFFMAAKNNKYQQGYDFSSPRMRQCFLDLQQAGHEVGFHPGYFTLNDPKLFLLEKKSLESMLGKPLLGGRQHYLRFGVPYTWRTWEQSGLSYDSSLGYADQEGFRCGTCWPYHPFDLEQDREMEIKEMPLIVMDTTLLHYRKMNPAEGKERILFLAQRCSEVGGVFTLLWHNSSVDGEWTLWFEKYKEILSELKLLF